MNDVSNYWNSPEFLAAHYDSIGREILAAEERKEAIRKHHNWLMKMGLKETATIIWTHV